MKTSTLIPVVAYLGLSGYTSAAPVNAEAGHALDKRTFCIFGFGWGCNTPTTTAAVSKPTASSAVSSIKAVVTSASAAKSSAAVVASSSAKAVSSAAASSAKVVSSAAASSSAKAVVSTSAAVTKTSSASWAACTDFDWNSWGSDWTWGGGFDKEYVKAWYVDHYGYAPPAGLNWRQVSSLVSKFGEKTKPASPKTTSKYTGGNCANPWTSAVVTKTSAAVTTSKAVSTSAAASKPVVTSVASSAAASKPVVSAPAASASASSSSKAVVPASSSASVVAGGPASSSAVVIAPSASSSAIVAPSASSSAVVVAPSASSSAVVVVPSASSSAVVVETPAAASSASASSAATSAAASSDAASPAASSDAASAPAASPSAGTGSSDGGSGVPGTGAGAPGTGAGSNNGTATSTADVPVATPSAPVSVNGYSYGGCAQEVTGRLLASVQTSSSSQSIESCTSLCSSYGYPVAGLEYGNECYCGTLEDIEDVAVSGECYMPCAGNANQICGGPNAINYYVDSSIIPPSVELPAGWSTYGVVSEGTDGRVLPVQIYSSNDNTVEVCANACANAGYKIAGTEYSSECFCGNAFVSSANGGQLVDDSAAFMACSGNLAQKCGGPSILSVTSAYGNNIPFA